MDLLNQSSEKGLSHVEPTATVVSFFKSKDRQKQQKRILYFPPLQIESSPKL